MSDSEIWIVCVIALIVVLIAVSMHLQNMEKHDETQRRIEGARQQISTGNDTTHDRLKGIYRWLHRFMTDHDE